MGLEVLGKKAKLSCSHTDCATNQRKTGGTETEQWEQLPFTGGWPVSPSVFLLHKLSFVLNLWLGVTGLNIMQGEGESPLYREGKRQRCVPCPEAGQGRSSIEFLTPGDTEQSRL